MTDTNVSLLTLMSLGTVGTAVTSQADLSMESGLPDFGDLLSQTGKTKDVLQVVQSAGSSLQTSDSHNVSDTVNNTLKSADAGKRTVKEADVSGSASKKIAKKLSPENQNADEQAADVEDVLSKISDQIVQIVSRELGIDSQQLVDTLEELGLTVGDLLDSSNLASLVSSFDEDAQPLELLMDSDFQNLLTELNTFTGELAQQMGITVSETVDLLTQAFDEQQMQQEMPTDVLTQQHDEFLQQTESTMEKVTDTEVQVTTGQPEQSEIIRSSVVKDAQPATEADTEEVTTTEMEEASLMEDKDSDAEDFFGKQEKSFFHEEGATQNGAVTQTQNTTVVTPEGTVMEQTVKVVDLQNLVSEITEYVKLISTSNQISSIEMQLNPANLGKVLVEVASEQGEVTARISTQTEAAKEAMEANVAILRDNLEQQGVKVSAVEVTVQSHAFEENLQEDGSKEQEQLAKEMQKENRRPNLNLNEMTLDDLQGLMSEEDMVIAKMMRDNGNVINIGA